MYRRFEKVGNILQTLLGLLLCLVDMRLGLGELLIDQHQLMCSCHYILPLETLHHPT
jgi:hypothetical protein